MKQKLIVFLSRYSYPQKDFANAIINFIKLNIKPNLLVDAPCGNGETTHIFAKKLDCKIIGADICETSINNAKKKYSNKINFYTKDINTIINEVKNVDAFCLINSIFLLPEPLQILQNIKKSLSPNGILYIIIPNIKSINYKNFIAKNPLVNNLQLNDIEFINYVQNIGYTLRASKKLCFANVFGRNELKLFSVFSVFYLRLLSFLFKIFSNKQPSYFLFIFSKN